MGLISRVSSRTYRLKTIIKMANAWDAQLGPLTQLDMSENYGIITFTGQVYTSMGQKIHPTPEECEILNKFIHDGSESCTESSEFTTNVQANGLKICGQKFIPTRRDDQDLVITGKGGIHSTQWARRDFCVAASQGLLVYSINKEGSSGGNVYDQCYKVANHLRNSGY